MFRKEVEEGEIIPDWYGVAYTVWYSRKAICYPVPLNLIVACFRNASIWLRFGFISVPHNAMDAYAQGFKDGRGQ